MKALFLSVADWEKKGGSDIKTYQKMIEALKHGDIVGEHRFVTTDEKLFADIKDISPDIIFSGAYYTFNEDDSKGRIHEMLENAGIPYVGADADALDVVLDKTAAKTAWRDAGIKTAEFFVLGEDNRLPEEGFPFLIKPSKEGSSRGMDENNVVYDNLRLNEICANLRSDGFDELFAETYLGMKRREFTIGVIGQRGDKLAAPQEMIYKRDGERPLIITHQMKEGDVPGNRLFEPEPVPNGEFRDEILSVAYNMYDTVNMRDYGRCDVIMDDDGRLNAVEINGQSDVGTYFLNGIIATGISYEQVINALFYSSIIRNQREGKDIEAPAKMRELLTADLCRLVE